MTAGRAGGSAGRSGRSAGLLAAGAVAACCVAATVRPAGAQHATPVDEPRDRASQQTCEVGRIPPDLTVGSLIDRASELFRRECWSEAARLLEEAVRRGANDPDVWRLLGTARFLGGEPDGALDAWNRIGAPVVAGVEVAGAARTPGDVYRRTSRIAAGDLLDRRVRTLGQRRLELLPGLVRARLLWEPTSLDRAAVRISVAEIPLRPRGWPGLISTLTPGLVQRELVYVSGSPFRRAGAARALWRWQEGRGAAEIAAGIPVGRGREVIAHVAGGWREETAGAPSPRAGTGVDSRDAVHVEETFALLGGGGWVLPRLRWRAGARWDGRVTAPSSVGAAGEAELRSLGARASVTARAGVHRIPSGGGGSGTGAVLVRLRSATDRDGWILHLEGEGYAVGDDAPFPTWPGAGTGTARAPLLRAHPLLEGGVIRGPAFGRSLVRVGGEIRWWGIDLGPLRIAPAAFLDGVSVRRTGLPGLPGTERDEDDALVDAGAGLRISLPGVDGLLRVDVATGLSDGAQAFSVGWAAPWPGLDRFADDLR